MDYLMTYSTHFNNNHIEQNTWFRTTAIIRNYWYHSMEIITPRDVIHALSQHHKLWGNLQNKMLLTLYSSALLSVRFLKALSTIDSIFKTKKNYLYASSNFGVYRDWKYTDIIFKNWIQYEQKNIYMFEKLIQNK